MVCSNVLILLVAGLPLTAAERAVEHRASVQRCALPPDIVFADSPPFHSGPTQTRSLDVLTQHPRRAWVTLARQDRPDESFPARYLNDDLQIRFSLPGGIQQPATVVPEGLRVTAVAPSVVPAPELHVPHGGVIVARESSHASVVGGDLSAQSDIGGHHSACTR